MLARPRRSSRSSLAASIDPGGFEPFRDVLAPDGRCARLVGFEPAGTYDSLVTFVPRRIAWVRAGSNHRPRPCKGRVIATRPRTLTVRNRAAELTLAFRNGTCFVERERAGRPASRRTERGCALGARAGARTAAGRALRGRAMSSRVKRAGGRQSFALPATAESREASFGRRSLSVITKIFDFRTITRRSRRERRGFRGLVRPVRIHLALTEHPPGRRQGLGDAGPHRRA